MIVHPELTALREILAGLDAGVFLACQGSQGLELVYVNNELENICGYSSAELNGRDLTVLCPARATLAEFQQFQNFSCTLKTNRTRLRCQRKDGSLIWLDLTLTPRSFRYRGKQVHCIGVMQNVTKQVSAENALDQSITQQQLILDSIGSPVLGLTANMDIKFCNKAYCQFVGLSIEELIDQNLLELFPSFKSRRTYTVYQQVLASGQQQALEGQMGDKYYHAVVYPTPWGIIAIAEDYTERREFEDELLNRDRLLLGFAQASVLLAGGARDARLINLALAELGKSAHVDRVYLLERHESHDGSSELIGQRYEWSKEGLPLRSKESMLSNVKVDTHLPRWYESFQRGTPIYGLTQHFPPEEQELLKKHGVVSVLIVPIMIQRKLWGLIGFDDMTRQREWRQSEIGVLLAAAASVGSAIAHQDAEARLLQERTLLQQVIDSIPDLVFYKDLESVYIGCNSAFTRFAGKPKKSIIGCSDIDLFPAQLASQFYEGDRQALSNRDATHVEEWVTYPDGHRVLLDTLKVPFNDAIGSVIGVLGVSRDITEKRVTEQVQREFVDNVSHELRTPITALLGLAETVQRAELSEEQRGQMMDKIESQAWRLAQLVDDILALSNLELAQQTMRRDRVDMRQVSRTAFDSLQTAALDKQLEYSISVDEQPTEIIGDATLLELLVTNLLSNAIRYTQNEGQVTLRVFAKPESVVIEVSDSGIGIEPEQKERIFERFFRADKARSRAVGGTGLGLAIVNQVLTLHSGEMKVISVPGEGSTFIATFTRLQETHT